MNESPGQENLRQDSRSRTRTISSHPAKPQLLSIIIPAHNEQENITPLMDELESTLSDLPVPFEVILVDDGSTDGTWRRALEEVTRRVWLRAIRLRGNRGQTAAMMAGIHAAEGELLSFLDADLQNDPSDFARLIQPILRDEADVVCGWRRDRKDNPLSRNFPSRVANFLIRRSFSLGVHDLGCTLKIFRKAYLENIRLYGEMHRFIVCYAQADGARIIEMTVNHRPRLRGKSKYGVTRVGKVLVDLLTVKLLNSYASKPAYFFGKIGLLFAVLGTIAFGIVAYRTLFLNNPSSTPMIFMMLLMYVVALFCFMSGLLAELSVRILHEVGGTVISPVMETAGLDDRRRAHD